MIFVILDGFYYRSTKRISRQKKPQKTYSTVKKKNTGTKRKNVSINCDKADKDVLRIIVQVVIKRCSWYHCLNHGRTCFSTAVVTLSYLYSRLYFNFTYHRQSQKLIPCKWLDPAKRRKSPIRKIKLPRKFSSSWYQFLLNIMHFISHCFLRSHERVASGMRGLNSWHRVSGFDEQNQRLKTVNQRVRLVLRLPRGRDPFDPHQELFNPWFVLSMRRALVFLVSCVLFVLLAPGITLELCHFSRKSTFYFKERIFVYTISFHCYFIFLLDHKWDYVKDGNFGKIF